MPIMLSEGGFNTGRDINLVLIGPYGKIPIVNPEGWDPKPIFASINVTSLDSTSLNAFIPKGWEATLRMARSNAAFDKLMATMELQWVNNGTINESTLFEYIAETDGSTSIFKWTSVAIKLDSTTWAPDASTKQTVSFMATYRVLES